MEGLMPHCNIKNVNFHEQTNEVESDTSSEAIEGKLTPTPLPVGVSGFSRDACQSLPCRNRGTVQCPQSENANCRMWYCSKKCIDEDSLSYPHICGPSDNKKNNLAMLMDALQLDQTPSEARKLESIKFDLRQVLELIGNFPGILSATVDELSSEIISGEPMSRFIVRIVALDSGTADGFHGMDTCSVKGVPICIVVRHEQGSLKSAEKVGEETECEETTAVVYGVGFNPTTSKSVAVSKGDVEVFSALEQSGLGGYREEIRNRGLGYKKLKQIAYVSEPNVVLCNEMIAEIDLDDALECLTTFLTTIKPSREWMVENGLSTENAREKEARLYKRSRGDANSKSNKQHRMRDVRRSETSVKRIRDQKYTSYGQRYSQKDGQRDGRPYGRRDDLPYGRRDDQPYGRRDDRPYGRRDDRGDDRDDDLDGRRGGRGDDRDCRRDDRDSRRDVRGGSRDDRYGDQRPRISSDGYRQKSKPRDRGVKSNNYPIQRMSDSPGHTSRRTKVLKRNESRTKTSRKYQPTVDAGRELHSKKRHKLDSYSSGGTSHSSDRHSSRTKSHIRSHSKSA